MPLRISSEWTQLRRIKQAHRTKYPKNSSKMKDKYGNYRRSKRDSESGPEQSTIVSVVYVTASPTFTGPTVGFMTLGPAVENISGSDVATTSEVMSSVINQTDTTSSASLPTSVTDEKTLTSTITSTSTATSSFTSSSYSLSSVSTSIASSSVIYSVTNATPSQSEQRVPIQSSSITPLSTAVPIAIAMAAPVPSPSPTSIVTSLEDLPLVIESPTSTVPKSMPLLVATSSSSYIIPLAPTSTEETLMQTPNPPTIPATNSESTAPKVSSSMGATGKASLIIGVVLLLGAVFMMLQVYLNKRRRATVGEKLEDDEKGGLKKLSAHSSAMSPSVPPKTDIQSNTVQGVKSHEMVKNAGIIGEKRLPSPSTSPPTNPFGKHAEILIDSTNAKGPHVIDRASPITEGAPIKLARVASMKEKSTQELDNASKPACLPKLDPGSPAPVNSPTKNLNPKISTFNGPIGTVNAVYRVQIDFSPSMDDELELRAGQLIRVLHEYDDGWAMCIRLDCSGQGVCPRTCLSTRPVKPRSSSGGSRGPPPAINVPMTPTSRPQSSARANGPGSPGVAHFGPTTPRLSHGHDAGIFNGNGTFKPHSQDPPFQGHQQHRAIHQEPKTSEVPMPLVLFPRGPHDNNSSREAPPAIVNTVTPQNVLSNSTLSARKSSPSITSIPECPGPMAPAQDYFSMNTSVSALPSQIDANTSSSITGTTSSNVILSGAQTGTSPHSSYQTFDHINDTSIPGQAL